MQAGACKRCRQGPTTAMRSRGAVAVLLIALALGAAGVCCCCGAPAAVSRARAALLRRAHSRQDAPRPPAVLVRTGAFSMQPLEMALTRAGFRASERRAPRGAGQQQRQLNVSPRGLALYWGSPAPLLRGAGGTGDSSDLSGWAALGERSQGGERDESSTPLAVAAFPQQYELLERKNAMCSRVDAASRPGWPPCVECLRDGRDTGEACVRRAVEAVAAAGGPSGSRFAVKVAQGSAAGQGVQFVDATDVAAAGAWVDRAFAQGAARIVVQKAVEAVESDVTGRARSERLQVLVTDWGNPSEGVPPRAYAHRMLFPAVAGATLAEEATMGSRCARVSNVPVAMECCRMHAAGAARESCEEAVQHGKEPYEPDGAAAMARRDVIEAAVASYLRAAAPDVLRTLKAAFNGGMPLEPTMFAYLGFDVVVEQGRERAWVIECNTGPALSANDPVRANGMREVLADIVTVAVGGRNTEAVAMADTSLKLLDMEDEEGPRALNVWREARERHSVDALKGAMRQLLP